MARRKDTFRSMPKNTALLELMRIFVENSYYARNGVDAHYEKEHLKVNLFDVVMDELEIPEGLRETAHERIFCVAGKENFIPDFFQWLERRKHWYEKSRFTWVPDQN